MRRDERKRRRLHNKRVNATYARDDRVTSNARLTIRALTYTVVVVEYVGRPILGVAIYC
jgi:hypothetical protein